MDTDGRETRGRFGRRPRRTDVAARAGVSPAVVSLVVNSKLDGNVRIPPATQERVWAAVRELGYVGNAVARTLAGGQNRIIGVFTYDPIFPLRDENFYHDILVGIEEEAEQRGYNLLLFTRAIGPDGTRRIFKDGINNLQFADGAVLLGAEDDRTEIAQLLDDGFPFAFVGRREVPNGEIPCATADYAAAAEALVADARALGHRRLAYFRGPRPYERDADREVGIRAGCARLGVDLPEDALCRDPLAGLTSDQVAAQLDAGATVCVTHDRDDAARLAGLLSGLGRRVPGDVGVVSLDDRYGGPAAEVPYSAFVIPRRAMGADAVALLVGLLENDAAMPRRTVRPCDYVRPASLGPAPSPGSDTLPG